MSGRLRLVNDDSAAFHYPANILKNDVDIRQGIAVDCDDVREETRGDLTTYSWKLNQTQIKFKHHETSGKMKIAFYYMPIANQVNAEQGLEGEPPEPIFPLSAVRQSEAIRSQMEFLSF